MRAYYNNLSVPHAIITLPQLREPLTPTDAPEAAKQIIVAVLLVAVLTMGAVVLHVAGLL